MVHDLVVATLRKHFGITQESAVCLLQQCQYQIKLMRRANKRPLQSAISDTSSVASVLATTGQTVNRILMDQQQASDFFDAIVNALAKAGTQIIQADLRPVLNLILLALQGYQKPITQASSLTCLDELLDIDDHRPQIWHWIQYTQGGVADAANDSKIHGFMRSMYNLINSDGNLGDLALTVLLKATRNRLLELFLCLLPSMYTGRQSYLTMLLQNFEKFTSKMVDMLDVRNGVTLITKFQAMGIPNFVISQCMRVLDSVDQKPTHNVSLPHVNFARHVQQVQDANAQITAVVLLIRTWLAFPSSLNIKHSSLTFDDDVDPTLEHQARSLIELDFGNVLASLRKAAMTTPDPQVRQHVIAGLFSLLESLATRDSSYDEALKRAIFKLLTFFLVEWHKKLPERNQLVKGFNASIDRHSGSRHDFTELVMPLCNVINLNAKEAEYLTFDDMELFSLLSEIPELDINARVAIAQVVENYMIRRHSQYRSLADRIFVQLVQGKQSESFQVQLMLKQHMASAVTELLQAESEVEFNNANDKEDSDEEVLQQIRYLYGHILGLAKGSKIFVDNFLQDYAILTLKSAQLRFDGIHIHNLLFQLGAEKSFLRRQEGETTQSQSQAGTPKDQHEFVTEEQHSLVDQVIEAQKKQSVQLPAQIHTKPAQIQRAGSVEDANNPSDKSKSTGRTVTAVVQCNITQESQDIDTMVPRLPISIAANASNVTTVEPRDIATQTPHENGTQTTNRGPTDRRLAIATQTSLPINQAPVRAQTIQISDQKAPPRKVSVEVQVSQDQPPVLQAPASQGIGQRVQLLDQGIKTTQTNSGAKTSTESALPAQPKPIWYSVQPSAQYAKAQLLTNMPSVQHAQNTQHRQATQQQQYTSPPTFYANEKDVDKNSAIAESHARYSDFSPNPFQEKFSPSPQKFTNSMSQSPPKAMYTPSASSPEVQMSNHSPIKPRQDLHLAMQTGFQLFPVQQDSVPAQIAEDEVNKQLAVCNNCNHRNEAIKNQKNIQSLEGNLKQTSINSHALETNRPPSIQSQMRHFLATDRPNDSPNRNQSIMLQSQSPSRIEATYNKQSPDRISADLAPEKGVFITQQHQNEQVFQAAKVACVLDKSNRQQDQLDIKDEYLQLREAERLASGYYELRRQNDSFKWQMTPSLGTIECRTCGGCYFEQGPHHQFRRTKMSKLVHALNQEAEEEETSPKFYAEIDEEGIESNRNVRDITKQTSALALALRVPSRVSHQSPAHKRQSPEPKVIGLCGMCRRNNVHTRDALCAQCEARNHEQQVAFVEVCTECSRTRDAIFSDRIPIEPSHRQAYDRYQDKYDPRHEYYQVSERQSKPHQSIKRFVASTDYGHKYDLLRLRTQIDDILINSLRRGTYVPPEDDYRHASPSHRPQQLRNSKTQTDRTADSPKFKSIGIQSHLRKALVPKEDYLLAENHLAKPLPPLKNSLNKQRSNPSQGTSFAQGANNETSQATADNESEHIAKDKAPETETLPIVNKPEDEEKKEQKMEQAVKRQTALAIRREIKKGQLTLKDLINKFYELEENYLIQDYVDSLRSQFDANCKEGVKSADTGEQCMNAGEFMKYFVAKKIKVDQEHIIDICRGESEIEAIKFKTFIKLQILASCAADKSRLGIRNFKKLMKHMGVEPVANPRVPETGQD